MPVVLAGSDSLAPVRNILTNPASPQRMHIVLLPDSNWNNASAGWIHGWTLAPESVGVTCAGMGYHTFTKDGAPGGINDFINPLGSVASQAGNYLTNSKLYLDSVANPDWDPWLGTTFDAQLGGVSFIRWGLHVWQTAGTLNQNSGRNVRYVGREGNSTPPMHHPFDITNALDADIYYLTTDVVAKKQSVTMEVRDFEFPRALLGSALVNNDAQGAGASVQRATISLGAAPRVDGLAIYGIGFNTTVPIAQAFGFLWMGARRTDITGGYIATVWAGAGGKKTRNYAVALNGETDQYIDATLGMHADVAGDGGVILYIHHTTDIGLTTLSFNGVAPSNTPSGNEDNFIASIDRIDARHAILARNVTVRHLIVSGFNPGSGTAGDAPTRRALYDGIFDQMASNLATRTNVSAVKSTTMMSDAEADGWVDSPTTPAHLAHPAYVPQIERVLSAIMSSGGGVGSQRDRGRSRAAFVRGNLV